MPGRAVIRVAAVALAALLLLSCRGYKRIGVSTMADIYADMMIADQWVSSNPEYRRTADTTLFYGSIFRKYGYDFKDFDGSVKYYLREPEKYQKIADLAYEKVSAAFKRIDEVKKRMEYIEDIIADAGPAEEQSFLLDSASSARFFEAPWFRADTIDSLQRAVPDSIVLPALDSLARPDSLGVRDSLPSPGGEEDPVLHNVHLKKAVVNRMKKRKQP